MRRAVLVGVALVLLGVAAAPFAHIQTHGLTARQARLAVVDKLTAKEAERQTLTAASRPGKAWALTPRNFAVRATTSRLAAATPSFGQPTIVGVQGARYAGTRARNFTRSPEAAAVMERADAALGFPLSRLISAGFQIGPTDSVEKERVAGEDRLAVHDEGHHVVRVSGGRERLHPKAPHLHRVGPDGKAELTFVLDMVGMGMSPQNQLRTHAPPLGGCAQRL